jgi:hypothetical protein
MCQILQVRIGAVGKKQLPIKKGRAFQSLDAVDLQVAKRLAAFRKIRRT